MAAKQLDKREIAAARLAMGRRIAELRKVTNLSQTEAAERAGLTRRNWVRIEKGESNVRLDTLLRIQSAFELDTLDALFCPTTGDLLQIRGREEA